MYRTAKKICVVLDLLFIVMPGLAQTTDLREYQDFFKEQTIVYQNWLNSAGLGQALVIENLEVDNQLLALTLAFQFADRDTATVAWRRLRNDFRQTSPLALEERLFFKLSTVMEVDFSQLQLRLINHPLHGQLPALDNTLYFDAADQKVKQRGGYRNEVKENILIPNFELDTSLQSRLKISTDSAAFAQDRYSLNNRLLDSLLHYFTSKTAEVSVMPLNRNPAILEVKNIKSEVIPNGIFSFTDPHEYLVITVDHSFTASGIELFCTIDGKHGSGFFRPRTVKGFRDMDPEFQTDLSRYIQNFTNFRLVEWVKEILRP